MIKLTMKNWSLVRMVGLIAAAVLIIFGSASNVLRSVKYGLGRILERR